MGVSSRRPLLGCVDGRLYCTVDREPLTDMGQGPLNAAQVFGEQRQHLGLRGILPRASSVNSM